jgi:pantothenate kinase
VYTYDDKSLLGTLSKVACGLGIRISQDTRFSTYDLSSICIISVFILTLTIQDAYDGGNESSKPVSIIIFEGLYNLQSQLPSAKGLSFTFMLSHHLLPLCTV